MEQCATPDVLCVQELLSREALQFFDTVCADRFDSRFRDDNRMRFLGRLTMRGCGLGIGARRALSRTLVRTFPGAHVGWDRFARKGAMYAQVLVTPDIVIDLVTVHLQSGDDSGAVLARARQLVDLKALIGTVGSRTRPFVVCGDFNIDGLAAQRRGAEYRGLLTALEGFEDLGAAADLPTFEPHPDRNALAYVFEPDASPQRIDYVFYRPMRGSRRLRLSDVSCFLDRPLPSTAGDGTRGCWPSDHYGLNATFEY